MNNQGTLGKILKLAIGAGIVYAAYKIGQQSAKLKNEVKYVGSDSEIKIEDNEEKYIAELIEEINSKPNKTKKDKINIELLEVKLKQLRFNNESFQVR